MNRLACLILLAAAVPTRAAQIRLTVLHTNDIHGWVMPRPAAFYAADPKRLIGGAAALAAYVKKVKGPKLVLDAGDWFQGTPEGSLRGGRSMAEVLDAVGYDALEVGNHDFDNGEANLEGLVKGIHAPVLCANVYRADGQHAPECKPWMVKDVAGVRVGIFGLLTTKMKDLAFPEDIAGLAFRRGVDEAKDAVAALREQGATVIIALSHQGLEPPGENSLEGDRFLAANVEGIDLIVGGHTHTALKEGLRDASHGTLIVQNGAKLSTVGEVTLDIGPKTKKVVKSAARLVDLWPDEVGSDPSVAALVQKLGVEVGAIYDVVLATAGAPLLRNPEGESALGDWMADCAHAWSGADLALQVGGGGVGDGGIRADIPAGPVTLREIFNVMPFDDHMVKMVMRGSEVKALLDQAVGMRHIGQVSGAQVSFHRHAPEGRRVESVQVAGRPLVDHSTYTVATIDYIAKGGDGYTAFASAQHQEFTKTLLRDVLKDCAQKTPSIKTPPAGRLLPLGD